MQWEGLRLATHFQPLYCVRHAKCHGFEARVHATDAAGASPRPDELRAATPQSRRTLLDWTLRALHLRNFARVDPGDRILFLGVHAQAAMDEGQGGLGLGELIRYYGLVPQRVCVEILEASRADEGLLREAISSYRALGVAIAIEDFGAALSSYERIARLRPDIVKIGRPLLSQAVIGGIRARRVLAASIELLHDAKARVAIADIENAVEAGVALDVKADFVQGMHFCAARAKLPDESAGQSHLTELLDGRRGRRFAVV